MRQVLASSLFLALGCVRVEGELRPAAAPTAPQTAATWQVGAGVVDITPPVGYGMAGHAIEARTSVGVWTRLHARAIAIEDRDGTPVVLVSTDLWAIPAGLTDVVAARLQRQPGLQSLGRAQVLIAATHTHHGPGHFHTAPGYADHAGSEPGFDMTLFDFLADQIVTAATLAYERRKPATLAHHRVAVGAIARNRSLEPFLHNPEASAWLEANADLPACEHPESATFIDTDYLANPCHAVDPTLDTLVARARNGGEVIAVAAVFGVHATAMPNRTPLYHGDLFGLASRDAQSALRERGHENAVVAMFNGPEGDVSPNWSAQGRGATQALGAGLAEAVVASTDTDPRPLHGTIGYALSRAPMSAVDVEPTDVEAGGTTGRRAFPGRSQFGGAEDGRTGLHARGFDEGRTVARERRDGHGAKRPALPLGLIALVHPKSHFPSFVPVGLVSLGPVTLVALPGEVTTAMGQRIEQRVSTARGVSGPAISVGLAGDYLSYFTTPQEYDFQHYEGASMMYGRLAGEALAQTAEDLARSPRVEDVGAFVYRGRGKTSLPKLTRKLKRPVRQAQSVIGETMQFTDTVSMQFDDAPSTWPDAGKPTTPRGRVEISTPEGWRVLADDEGDAFVLHVGATGRKRWQWVITWLEPFVAISAERSMVRLRVDRADGSAVCSVPFHATATERGQREVGQGSCDRPVAE